jgi:hypothetical protein
MALQVAVSFSTTVAMRARRASIMTHLTITQSLGKNYTNVARIKVLTSDLRLKVATLRLEICCSSEVVGKKRTTTRVMMIVRRQRSGTALERMAKTDRGMRV